MLGWATPDAEEAVLNAKLREAPFWTVERFRSFTETRPDEERWELLDGVAVMMTPPTLIHQRIASNLDRLLNDALARHDRTRMAIQRPGLDLLPLVENYQPEPDVAVIGSHPRRGERYVRRFFLAAEVVSETDMRRNSASDLSRLENKRAIYRQHEHCVAVLLIDANELVVELDRRVADEWLASRFTHADDVIELAAFGFRCRVADLYDGTGLG
jgi:Uma2 family endonuclease